MPWLTRPNRTTEVLLTLVCGIAVGLISVYLNISNASTRITTLVLAAALGGIVVLVIGDLRRLLLVVVFLDLATGTDFNLTCRTDYFMSACGFNFSATTLALAGLYVLWIIDVRRNRNVAKTIQHPRFGLIGKAAVGFLLAMILSLIAARNVELALYQLWVYVTIFALFFYLANNVTSKDDVLYIVGLVVLGLFIQNVIMQMGALGVLETGVSRVTQRIIGTLHSPNNAGGYLAQIFTILLACLFLHIPRWQKWFLAGILLLTLYNLVGTESRGGWTSVVIGISVVTLVSLLKRWLKFNNIILALIVAVSFMLLFSGTITDRLTGDDNGAADARGPLAQIAFNMIRSHPMIGVGLNNFGVVLYDYIEPDQFGAWLNLVHNGWLLIWSETGTIGLIFYLALWLTTLWQALKLIWQGHPVYAVVALGIFASLLGTSTHMMVEIFGARILAQIIWTEAALVAAMTRLQKQERRIVADQLAQPSDASNIIVFTPDRKSM